MRITDSVRRPRGFFAIRDDRPIDEAIQPRFTWTLRLTLGHYIPSADLVAYGLQIERQGDPNAATTEGKFWIGSLTESGHTVSLYGHSQTEIEQRATEILVARYLAADAAKLEAAEMAEERSEFVVFGRSRPGDRVVTAAREATGSCGSPVA